VKSDAPTKAIVECLRAAGTSVHYLDPHRSGAGLPDLLVGFRGYTYLMEVKRVGGKLNPKQTEWHANWKGDHVHVVHDAIEALRVIGLTPEGGSR
jgi:hypothetical protein